MGAMDNRTHLMDCALTLFSARGYDAVGIQEVVETAGVTKPTLYHYFSSKRGLLDQLLETHFTELTGCVAPAALYQGDLSLTLERIARAYFSFARQNPAFFRLELTLYFSPPESEGNQAVAPYSAAQQARLEDVFNQAVTQNGNMRGRTRIYAATYLGMLNTYIGFFLNGYLQLDDALIYQTVHQFMHGILS